MKGGLVTVSEIFREKREKELESLVGDVLPASIIKMNYEKQFIAIEAKKAVKAVIENGAFPAASPPLLEGCASKNLSIAEMSVASLNTFCQNAAESFFSETDEGHTLIKVLCDMS